MGFNEFMTKLFGNKSQRDLKEITPYVDKVKAVYPSIKALSNDELRAKTDEIKQRIQDYVAEEKAQVEELRKGIEDKELEEREAIWAEVDKIEKAITDKMEVVLEQSLPEVFAIMNENGDYWTGCFVWQSLYDKANVSKTPSYIFMLSDMTLETATGVKAETAAAAVVGTQYYTVSGTKVSAPQKGINIRVQKLSDGRTVTSKIMFM